MKVSVSIITYNQERWVAQAIDSALAQRVDFPYEIVVGDDGSSDGTAAIVRDFARRHPDRVRALLHPSNLGGEGVGNFRHNVAACRGQYLAVLDGDDFWDSPDKLRRQVDLLDRRPELSLCFHSYRTLDPDGSSEVVHPPGRKGTYELDELLQENFIGASSVVYRRALVGELPPWYGLEVVPDWVLHILHARHGPIGYLPEVMSVYRRHQGGVASRDHGAWLLERGINTCARLRQVLPERHHRHVEQILARKYLKMAKLRAGLEEWDEARRALWTAAGLGRWPSHATAQEVLFTVLAVHAPRLLRLWDRARRRGGA